MKSLLESLAEAEEYVGILPQDVAAVLRSMIAVTDFFDIKELEDYIENLNRGHTIAPILDPTAYMMGSKNLEDNIEAAKIILKFKKLVRKLQEG